MVPSRNRATTRLTSLMRASSACLRQRRERRPGAHPVRRRSSAVRPLALTPNFRESGGPSARAPAERHPAGVHLLLDLADLLVRQVLEAALLAQVAGDRLARGLHGDAPVLPALDLEAPEHPALDRE